MKNATQYYIIFDIDSSSVGVLVFDILSGKNIFTTREYIDKGKEIDFSRFLNKTIKTFESVVKKSHSYFYNNIFGVFVNLSSPWISSQKRIIHFEKENEFIFTKEIESSIFKKELNKSLNYTSDFIGNSNISIIERRKLNILINGYLTKEPYGKKTKSVDIHSLISVISNETKYAFTHVIERAFHIQPDFFSNKFMNYKSIINLFKHENNVISIDISGEVTEISIIIKDRLKKIGTIPVGMSHIIRYLSNFLNISYLKSESMLIMYQNNELEKKYKDSIESAMKKSFLFWFRQFYDFLEEASKEYVIPSTIHLLSPEPFYNWLSEWILKTEEIGEYIHTNKNISILDTKSLLKKKDNKLFDEITDDNLVMCLNFVKKFLINNRKK